MIMRDVIYEPTDRCVPTDFKTGKYKKREQKPIQSSELQDVNKRFQNDRDATKALHQIKKSIIPTLKAAEGESVRTRAIDSSRFIEANQSLFNDFWETIYEDDDNDNVDESNVTARFEFLKALELVNPLPLESVDKKTLKRKWESLFLSNLQNRRYGTRINQLLGFAKKSYKLKLPRRSRNPDVVAHVTIEQFEEKMIPNYPTTESKLLAQVLFGTGMRYSEAMAVDDPNKLLSNRTFYVYRQMLKKGKIVNRIKNNKPHNTVVLPGFIEAFKAWASIPVERKRELRLSSAFEKTTSVLTKKIFTKSVNQLTNHDFRHCYAVHMMSVVRLSISEIAMLLGDDETTVRDHYIGFVISDDHVDLINKRIDSQFKFNAK